MRRWQIGRVVRVESEPHPLVGDVVSGKSVVQESTGGIQQVGVPPSHDDPSKWSGLTPAKRRSVRLDHRSPLGIHPDGKSIASEAVHRNCDLHMLQERAQRFRVIGIVQPGGQMDSQPAWLNDGVVRGSRLLGCPTGELVRATVLRSTMKRHEPNGGTQDALLPDAGQAQEFSEIDSASLPPRPVGRSRHFLLHLDTMADPLARRSWAPPPAIGDSQDAAVPPLSKVSPSARTWLSVLSASGRGGLVVSSMTEPSGRRLGRAPRRDRWSPWRQATLASPW